MAKTVAPIKRAIVQTLRASAPLTAAIAGGINESVAPRKVKYPFIVFQLVSGAREYQFDGSQIQSLWDISVFAENPVDASNVDALIEETLNDVELSVDGQTNMLCRRVAELPTGPDTDSRGRRIFQVGGSYSVWTDVT
jgi:hypothetical protein